MNSNPIKTIFVGAVLAIAAPLFAQDDVEITMQVLDDLSGVEGVLMALEKAPSPSPAPDTRRRETEPAPAAEPPSRNGAQETLRELDRDEARGGELEDFDVPADVQLEAP